MKIIKVDLRKHSYNIVVGSQMLNLLGKHIKRLNLGSSAYIITNSLIKAKYADKLINALEDSGIETKLKLIPDTEKSKSLEMASRLIRDITVYDKKRRVFIIAFGGGVVGDLAGFVASIYKRGIPYIQVPTTLLAQVDSSIGGKTAVDLVVGKNLVGAFYQPRLVFSDVQFLQTLSPHQVSSGLAEVIKYGVIKDAELFGYLERKCADILALKPLALKYIVERSSRIKAGIVSQDEKETKGLRTVLNFGHTIGHAIEKAAEYKRYTHGEAVALGMIAASYMSEELGLINRNTEDKIKGLITSVGLPVRLRGISVNKVICAHYCDKKFSGAKNKFVLVNGIGKAKIVENIPLGLIREAIKKIS